MLPIVSVPETIASGLAKLREAFCRDEGFEYVSRYVCGLVLSPNKTMQGIYDAQVWEGEAPSRRAMHAAVFEAGWDSAELMRQHRREVARDYPRGGGRGRAVIGLDWTLAHHDRGEKIFGVKEGYDYVEHRYSSFQTVVTAVVANRELIDGLAVEVQEPLELKAEEAYLKATARDSYQQMEQVQQRLLELLHHQVHRLQYRKRTEMAVEIVRQLEAEGQFPEANYAFDNGVLTVELTRLIESAGKHWVSEIESSRLINWQGRWRRVDGVAEELRQTHPESFRPVTVRKRNGEEQEYWCFTKVVRLKKYGRKRLVIVHEREDLSDTPRFLLCDALHWESGRVIETWSYRWASEIFHEFSKQVCGLEAAQVRREEAVRRHFRLSCVTQSLLQRAPAGASKSERFAFARGEKTFGQQVRTIAREALLALLKLCRRWFADGKSTEAVLELLMPA